MPSGFMYLAAVIDWYSRYVVAWRLSNTLDGSFCLEMLEEALEQGQPEVFNTDQGVQFTAQAWTGRLEGSGVAVSMDGKGRCLDNIFVERLWRSVKYEYAYPCRPESVRELERGLRDILRVLQPAADPSVAGLPDALPRCTCRKAEESSRGKKRE